MTRIRLAVCCLLACAAARAEDPPMLTEHAFLDELPVVLSVTRLAQPISESPTAVTLVDREMIVASGARDIPEVLRLVPGMAVGFESGHNPVVTYHGLADQFPRRMQVLVDGRSIYTPDVASVRWSDLPLALEDIERIEVIRGPAAATYGANSFLGAISITTRHPAEVRGALLAVRRGSEGIEDGVLRYAASLGAVDLRGTFAYRSDAGFDQRFDDRRIRQATLRADYRAGLADSIELQLGASEVPRQDGFVGDDVQPIRTVTGRSHYEQLRWRHTLGEEQELSLQAYHRHQRHDDRLGGFALPVLDASLETDRYDLELQHTVGSGTAGWRLVWGAGGRLDQLRAPLYFARADTLENQLWHGFGNLEFRLGSLLVNAGAMLEQSDIAGRQLSPRLALSYHLTPQQTVRAGVSRAYHTPGLFDTLADLRVPLLPPPLPRVSLFRGGLDLEPESILSREIGYMVRFSSLGLTLDVKLFRDELRRLIATEEDTDPFVVNRFVNRDEVEIEGVETQLDWRPSQQVRVFLSHGYADADNAAVVPDDAGYKLLQSVPTHTFSLLAMLRPNPASDLSLGYYLTSEQLWLGNGDLIPARRRLDLRAARRFELGSSRLELAAVIQNLLDPYTDFLDDPDHPAERNVFDRRMFLTVQLEF